MFTFVHNFKTQYPQHIVNDVSLHEQKGAYCMLIPLTAVPKYGHGHAKKTPKMSLLLTRSFCSCAPDKDYI